MGKTPKVPGAPPPSPTPPSFSSGFAGGRQRSAQAASMGGTFLTQAMQPLIRANQRKTLLGQ